MLPILLQVVKLCFFAYSLQFRLFTKSSWPSVHMKQPFLYLQLTDRAVSVFSLYVADGESGGEEPVAS